MNVTRAQLDQLYKQSGFKSLTEEIQEKASKLKNRKKEVDGITFSSGIEARAYQILKLWQMAGAIRDLELQPPFVLQPKFRDEEGEAVRAIKYLADFRFFDVARNKMRYVDTKGYATALFKLKRKMLRYHFPQVELELWTKTTIKELSRC